MPRWTLTTEERFWTKVIKGANCWLWGGGVNPKGYGRFFDGIRLVYAHRFAYERLVGQIPIGLTLDHLCRIHNCVRPEHLEPMSLKANIQRGNGASAQHARQTLCVHGHPFDLLNTYISKRGTRTCRQCRRERMRIYQKAH